MDDLAWSEQTNIKGPAGPPGPGMVFKGQVATVGDLPAGAAPGDAYTVTADGHMYVWDGAVWIDGGVVVGPPGPPGAASTVPGPQGPKGDTGLTGTQGAIGPQGIPGPTGSQGTAGATGNTGAQGPQGIQGPIGPTGPTGGAIMAIGDGPPASPVVGQIWWESDTGNMFIYYDDGNSTQWVPAHVGTLPGGGTGGGISEAPLDSLIYARQNADWIEIPGIGGISPTEYTYNATAFAPPPNTNNLRLNNANQTLATRMYLHHTNALNIDVSNALRMISQGNTLLIQDKTDATHKQYYTVTGPITDFTTYTEVPIAWSSGGAAVTAGRVMLAAFGLGSASTIDWNSVTGKPDFGTASEINIHVGATAPPAPVLNDVWIDTT